MKQDLFFYLQLVLFAINVFVGIYIGMARGLKYKAARVVLIIAVCIGFFLNLGKVSWFAVLFCFSPFLSLINFRNERLDKYSKRIGDNIRSGGKHLEKLQGHSQAYNAKKA